MSDRAWVVTCEHGGNRIPVEFARYFARGRRLLDSHRGYDQGALAMARRLAAALAAPLHAATVSRLLIDLNRSPGHPQLYSAATRHAPPEVRRDLMERYYRAYRDAVEAEIARAIAGGRPVIHISSHSFTPRLDGVQRRADIGLLYDPRRLRELEFCRLWRTALNRLEPRWVVRRNYPYRGRSDGFTAFLRRRFDGERYLGIELEINQKHPARGGRHWRRFCERVVRSVVETLAEFDRTA